MGSPRSLFVRTTGHEIISAERWTFLVQCWGLLTLYVGTTGMLLLEATACFTIARRLKTRVPSERVCARLPSVREVANRHLPRNYACASIAILTGIISWSVDSILRRTRKIAKSDYELLRVGRFVRPSAWNSTPTGRILMKFYICFFLKCRENSSFTKI